MHDTESRAVRRAVAILLLVSLARWGWAQREERTGPTDTPSALPELADRVADAVDEEARRARPLAPGQRIDPNVASEIELDRLPGVGRVLAHAIVAARDEGASFAAPEDLLGVRGIGPSFVARAAPHLTFGSRTGTGRGGRAAPARVDINRADLRELQRLPGVGPTLAERIVAKRRKSPFRRVDDLLGVRGIGPATLERLRPLASVRSGR